MAAKRTTCPRRTPTTEITAQPTVAASGKGIVYDPETRDFAMYLDGELVGFAKTHDEAERTLDDLVYEILERAYGPMPQKGGDGREMGQLDAAA